MDGHGIFHTDNSPLIQLYLFLAALLNNEGGETVPWRQEKFVCLLLSSFLFQYQAFRFRAGRLERVGNEQKHDELLSVPLTK